MPEEGILNVGGFIRRFKIADDVPRQDWATIQQAEIIGEGAVQAAQEAISVAISSIRHSALVNIGMNDHHSRDHSDSHQPGAVDALNIINFTDDVGVSTFQFKNNSGTIVLEIDSYGNIKTKGRLLRI